MVKHDIAEAKLIIAKLSAIADQLKPGDARFLETWQSYLQNVGNSAQLGKWRMHSLRSVAASYGIVEAQDTAPDMQLCGLD